jgi:hypothetical protein
MPFRDDEVRGDAAAAHAERRTQARCRLHAEAWADGACDLCHGDFCGACLAKPPSGETLCPTCLEVRRRSYLRAHWWLFVLAFMGGVAVLACVAVLVARRPELPCPDRHRHGFAVVGCW